jgi:hypothetical protein
MSGKEFLERLEAHRHLREELGELSKLLAAQTELPARRIPGWPEEWPLLLYGRYEIREILTAVGWLNESRRTPHQSGKIALAAAEIECLFVTLDKAEGYHDRISYRDYAISPSSSTGKRRTMRVRIHQPGVATSKVQRTAGDSSCS